MLAEPAVLRDTLARLNQIGRDINQLGLRDLATIRDILGLIVRSATEVVPGSSAVIYEFNEAQGVFDPDSRLSVEEDSQAARHDDPRPKGIGSRAVEERRRVLSNEEKDVTIHPGKVAVGARVMACYPLMIANEVLGVLAVIGPTRMPYQKVIPMVDLTAKILSRSKNHLNNARAAVKALTALQQS